MARTLMSQFSLYVARLEVIKV